MLWLLLMVIIMVIRMWMLLLLLVLGGRFSARAVGVAHRRLARDVIAMYSGMCN